MYAGCAGDKFGETEFGTSFFCVGISVQLYGYQQLKYKLAMKISIVSILTCALALSLSFASIAGDKKKSKEEKETAGAVKFDAALYKINDTNKVKLSVNKSENDRLRVVLKDKGGKIYYSEVFNERDSKYRRVFNLDEMVDGTYYFELSHKKDKMVKEVNIQSTNSKQISLQ